MFRFYKWEELHIVWQNINMKWELIGYETEAPAPFVRPPRPVITTTTTVQQISSLVVESKEVSKKTKPIYAVLGLGDIRIQKLNAQFKRELQLQKNFFDKPDILKTLSAFGLAALAKFLVEKYSEDDIKKFLRLDKGARDFMKYSSSDFDEQVLSDMLLKCQNGEISEQQFLDYLKSENLTAEGFLNVANQQNDFDSKSTTAFDRLHAFIKANEKTINKTLTYSFLFYYIILQTINLLKNTEHPSKYRTKYIQRLSRNLNGLIKHQIKEVSTTERPQWDIMSRNLKKIDDLLLAMSMATALYFVNRSLLQKKSQETLQTIAKDKACIDITPAGDVSVNILPFQNVFDCPVNVDDIISPHEPIESKLANISCEFTQPETSGPDIKQAQDLVTNAIIKNNRVDKMNSILTVDAFVDQKTVLGNINGTAIYAPIEGFISNLLEYDC